MKTGTDITTIAGELKRQRDTDCKVDFIADTRKLRFDARHHLGFDSPEMETKTTLLMEGHSPMPMSLHTEKQIAQRIGIPSRYFEKMRKESPELLNTNVNHWFQNNPETRMVRTLDNRARAFLSDKYRPLDNVDLFEAVYPELENTDHEIVSSEITDNRFYLKALSPKIKGDVGVGDIVQGGVMISNSEIGLGALKVEMLLFRLVCENGMIAPAGKNGKRKYHVGRRKDANELPTEFLRDETMRARDKAFWMEIQDIVRNAVDGTSFEAMMMQFRATKERKIEGEAVKAVEVLAKKFSFTQDEQSSIIDNLVAEGDMSQFGLANAVTRTASDLESYDRATEFERFGGDIVALPERELIPILRAA